MEKENKSNPHPAFVPHFWNATGMMVLALLLVAIGILLHFFPLSWFQNGIHFGWGDSDRGPVVTAEDIARIKNGENYRHLCDVSSGCRHETVTVSSDAFTDWIMVQKPNDYDTKVVYGNFSSSTTIAYEVSYDRSAVVFTCEIKKGFDLNRGKCVFRMKKLPAYYRFRAYEGEPTKLDVFVVHKDSGFAKEVGL
jgi:hypothetical protein